MVIKGRVVVGYTEDVRCDARACEKHVETFLAQGGCKNVTVKIFNELEAYCKGLENLRKQEEEPLPEEILENLLSISL